MNILIFMLKRCMETLAKLNKFFIIEDNCAVYLVLVMYALKQPLGRGFIFFFSLSYFWVEANYIIHLWNQTYSFWPERFACTSHANRSCPLYKSHNVQLWFMGDLKLALGTTNSLRGAVRWAVQLFVLDTNPARYKKGHYPPLTHRQARIII